MELTKNIVCSLSVKVQHETYGGEKYTSTDLFESESEMVPTSMDFDEVQVVWNVLRRRVEARIGERKRELIASLSKRGYQTPPAPPTPLSVAPTASQTPPKTLRRTPANYPVRFPANSQPAQPKEVVPDTPEGAPFP